MKHYQVTLECSHTQVAHFDHNPADRHTHLICNQCGGGYFAVLRATEITTKPANPEAVDFSVVDGVPSNGYLTSPADQAPAAG